MMDLKRENTSVKLSQWHIRITCSLQRFNDSPLLISSEGDWLVSCWSTSLRTGHTATTHGCPPVVKEDFTVTSQKYNSSNKTLFTK